jgi:integrase
MTGLFSFAIGEELLGDLTVSPIAKMKRPAQETTRDRVLDDKELKAVLQAAEKLNSPFGVIVQLLAYTGQRRNEVAHMRWDELKLHEAIWIMPPERTKNKKEHKVMLAPQVVEILKSVPRGNGPFVFTDGTTPLTSFSKGTADLKKLVPTVKNWTLNDLRRTVATGKES